MPKPRHIILLIADSLRYDSVHKGGDAQIPYLSAHGSQFTQARSGGCWTLPATASMFTGLMPHEHGADAQSRGLREDVRTLSEGMRAAGYTTHQVTANVATSEIFGLDRGFDGMHRIWKMTPAQHKKIHELLILVGKPRLRRKLFSTEFVTGRLSEDLDASKVWLQSTANDVFNQARVLLDDAEKENKGAFLFLNLMESHFPYHLGQTFDFLSEDFFSKIREVVSLYHLVNQTWLTKGSQPIHPEMLELIRQRQRLAWQRLAPMINAFVEEMHTRYNATVVFGADHGDNFGEQGWVYHFSNVTDAGNHVPLYWLKAGQSQGQQIHTPVSARDIYQGLLQEAGDTEVQFHPVAEPERSVPIMQSCWYNNQGRTLPQYKYNQICFIEGQTRWLHRMGQWSRSPVPTDITVEDGFEALSEGANPIEEVAMDAERRRYLRQVFSDFQKFSARIMEKA